MSYNGQIVIFQAFFPGPRPDPVAASAVLLVRLGQKELGKPILQPADTHIEERAQKPLIAFIKNDVRLADTYYRWFLIYTMVFRCFLIEEKILKIAYNYVYV